MINEHDCVVLTIRYASCSLGLGRKRLRGKKLPLTAAGALAGGLLTRPAKCGRMGSNG